METDSRIHTFQTPVKEFTWDAFGKWKGRQDMNLPGYNH